MSMNPLAAEIADRLRRDILRGKLLPGAPIKERDNADELGVSRTPMREAIRILAQEGLVILRPARSPIVANPSHKEVVDQVQVIIALEALSGRLACAHATDDELAEIARIETAFEDVLDTADPLDVFEADMAFHTAIARASHNDALAETHRSYLARLWRVRYLTSIKRLNRKRASRHHTALLNALFARDPDAFSEALSVHLGGLADDARSVIETPPTPQEPSATADG